MSRIGAAMKTFAAGHFTAAVHTVLDETFDDVRGIYLDKGTSFFETLAEIDAAKASIPVGGNCATLAAQVKHVAFYFDAVVASITDPEYPGADWNEIWETVREVDEAEWEDCKRELRESYGRILTLLDSTPEWGEEEIAGAIGMVAHTAYHLGEIRQALCFLRS